VIYIPKQFEQADRAQLFRLMRQNSFATLISVTENGPLITHLPVMIDEQASTLHGHVARSNPVWHGFGPDHELLFIFHGPHHYISPTWYTVQPSVPTWNYAVVHVKGCAKIIDDRGRIESMLHQLVNSHESVLSPSWSMNLPANFMEKMVSNIVAFEVAITQLQGKFKLSQNRPLADRMNVISALRDLEDPDAANVAELMDRALRD
jgi:transcriptional regulator